MEIKETLNKNNQLFEYNISEILIKKDQNYILQFLKSFSKEERYSK